MNIGIVGAGLWGMNHAHVFNRLPETNLLAVCDLNPERAERMRSETHAKHVFTSYEELIACSGIEAVSIATPDFAHAPIILAALRAGKHVLTEKPMAMTVEEAREIVLQADRSPGKLMVDFHNRVNPIFAKMRGLIEQGTTGPIRHGVARLSNTTFVPLEMLQWSAKSSSLWFLGSHLVDILRFLLADDVKRVYATARKGVLTKHNVDINDFYTAILEFQGGAVVAIETSWILPKESPALVDFKVELVGETGQVQADPTHNGGLRQTGGSGLKFHDYIGIVPTGETRFGGFVYEAIARFADSVVRGAPLLADARDGLENTKILCAIEDSVRTSLPVDIVPEKL